ncbi:unnamed protein product, partial [Mesorhabditis spiculigera]
MGTHQDELIRDSREKLFEPWAKRVLIWQAQTNRDMTRAVKEMLESRIGLSDGKMCTVSSQYCDWPKDQPQHKILAAAIQAWKVVRNDSTAALRIQSLFRKEVAKDFGPEMDTMFFQCSTPNRDVLLMVRRHGINGHSGARWERVTMSLTANSLEDF